MTQIIIVGAVLDNHELTLYKEDGSTISIPQGDPRIENLVNTALPILKREGRATVDLTKFDHFRGFEQKSNGLVRFFKVAKNKLSRLLTGSAEGESQVVGKVSGFEQEIQEVMAHAVPASSHDVSNLEKDEETVVALVGEGKDATILSGIEKLVDQIVHANRQGSIEGVRNLIIRLSKVEPERRHSVEDVLRFLSKSDLPLADDGSIIAYKLLIKGTYGSANWKDVFYDWHTGRVTQRIGSVVCVDPSLVDTDRNNECSNGLHIARRDYLGSFSGDVCVLIRLAPEDVITVPHGDTRKVRVCRYEILALLSDEAKQALSQNRPMTDLPSDAALLEKALRGKFPKPVEEVLIRKQRAEEVVITPLNVVKQKAPKVVSKPKEPKEVMPALALDDARTKKTVDPKKVSKKISKTPAAEPAKKLGPRQQYAQEMFKNATNKKLSNDARKAAAEALVRFRKEKKVGWKALGLPENVEHQLIGLL